ncbi:MAG: tetratricopeptide repeat protein [Planctomycetaceae bacterium]|nr:tetratricopeptide repeat protein [Planctomycetaceae bacterium]
MHNKQNDNRPKNDGDDYAGPLFTIRWKWLLGSFALMAILGTALVALYYYQTKDQNEFRIDAFRNAEEAGQWREGIQQLLLYQQERPNDMQIVRELAEAYDRNGISTADRKNAAKFYLLLSNISHSTSDAERLTILEKLLENQGRVGDAEEMFPTIQRILEISPENPAAWRGLVQVRSSMLTTGIYKPGAREPKTFDLLVKKAMELNPENVVLVNVYARLLRSTEKNTLDCLSQELREVPLATRIKEADAMMADFAKNHSDSPEVLLTEYDYRREYRLLDPEAVELDEALAKVQQLEPDNPIAMMYVGLFYELKAMRTKFGQSQDEYQIYRQAAIDRFEQVIQAAPEAPDGYLQLAAIYSLDEEREKQIEVLERGNRVLGSNNLRLLVPLVTAYLENNDPKNADRCIRLIFEWTDRNRGRYSTDLIGITRQIATLLEGQSLAVAGQPMEAVAKLKSVLEPIIPNKPDVRLVYASLMMYAQLLIETLNSDSAVGVYEQTIRYLETGSFTGDPMNFARLDRAYVSLVGVLRLVGQSDYAVALVVNRYLVFLRRELYTKPENHTARLSLASVLFQQIMEQPSERRNWSELDQHLKILQGPNVRIAPPWQVDFLQAAVTWEKLQHAASQVEEVLMPLRLAENRYGDNLLFLISLEDAFHHYKSLNDRDRVLDQIRGFPDGMPFWYLIKAMRAEQLGNTLEAKRLIDEAMTVLPESQKSDLLLAQETLGRSVEEYQTSVVRERQTLERLRQANADNPTIPSLFRQGLMELDFGNTATVAQLEIELRKQEGKEGTLVLLLEAERMLQEAVDEKDPKITVARGHLQTLRRKRPNWEYTYLLAADIEDRLGNERGVMEELAKAIDMGNRDPLRYRDLIGLYRKTNQENKAEAVRQRGIGMFPNLMAGSHFRFEPPYQTMFGNFARAIRREDVDQARQIAGQWLDLADKNKVEQQQTAFFHSIIAQSFFSIDQLSVAEQYFVAAAESGGETVLPLARYLGQVGKMQEAMHMIYTEMTQSETPEYYFRPVLALMRDYEYDPAWVEPFDAFILNVQPSQITEEGPLFQYVNYWVIREKNDLALPFYRRWNELSANNAKILNDLAYLAAFQQTDDADVRDANIKEGLSLINKAITLEEANANLIDTKGLIVLQQGQPDAAVPLFEKAVELEQSNQAVIYRLHLAVALLRNREMEKAKDEFAEIRGILVPQVDLLPESNRDYTRELLEAFPEEKNR